MVGAGPARISTMLLWFAKGLMRLVLGARVGPVEPARRREGKPCHHGAGVPAEDLAAEWADGAYLRSWFRACVCVGGWRAQSWIFLK